MKFKGITQHNVHENKQMYTIYFTPISTIEFNFTHHMSVIQECIKLKVGY